MIRTCIVDDCTTITFSGTMCPKHTARVRKYGDPHTLMDPAELSRRRSGANNGHWKGDQVGYHAAHGRITTARGRAAEHTCRCGRAAEQWAYTHDDPHELIGPEGLPYSTDTDRYVPMCASCHKLHDLTVRDLKRVAVA